MRKEKKQSKRIAVSGIQSYHGGNYETETYAQEGFTGGFKVFTSDRTQEPNGTQKTFGVEIELESVINSSAALGAILEKVVFPTFPAGLFKQQRDRSLGGNSSSECITQPMTKAFIRNHYNTFKAMWLFLRDIGTAPGDSCGMHVNIGLANFGKDEQARLDAVMRLNNWICDNYEFAAALFKRGLNNTTYCSRRRRDYLSPANDHHAAVNYSHMGPDAGTAARVEIRLVGPQKTFGAFRNTMEVVFHLIDACRTGRNMNDPEKLWAGCNECVLDRLHDLIGHGITVDQYAAIEAKAINSGIMEATR